MTRDEAIEYIECGEISNRWGKEGEEAERMAIEALKAEPKLRQALEQEKGAYNALVANVHCNDCISRQAAIYAINHAGVNFNVNSKFDLSVLSKEIREIVCHIAEAQEKALNDLPLVAPQQRAGRWIPVSERVPEDEEEVLCFLESEEMAVLFRRNNWGQDEWVDGGFATGSYDVIAWMPLPEPYKAESEVDS